MNTLGAECVCAVAIYAEENRICTRCKRFVPLEPECESCGAPLDVPLEQLCAACMHKHAMQANEVARQLLGCGEEQCQHEQQRRDVRHG